jgi:hypothetical protein
MMNFQQYTTTNTCNNNNPETIPPPFEVLFLTFAIFFNFNSLNNLFCNKLVVLQIYMFSSKKNFFNFIRI